MLFVACRSANDAGRGQGLLSSPCSSTDECAEGFSCVPANHRTDTGFGCGTQGPSSCATDEDCWYGGVSGVVDDGGDGGDASDAGAHEGRFDLVCAVGACGGRSCISACKTDADCKGQLCSGGHCGPRPCSGDTDCAGFEVCRKAICVEQKPCTVDTDCGNGHCVQHWCASVAGVCQSNEPAP
jgi:hypothetical protein